MDKKKFSATAHLLHSRLQLAAKGLIIKPDRMGILSAPHIVWQNKWLFQKVKTSVEAEHGIEVSLKDLNDAAELIVIASKAQFDGRYQVQTKLDGEWRSVKLRDGGAGFIQADPTESLSFIEAAEMYAYIAIPADTLCFRISQVLAN